MWIHMIPVFAEKTTTGNVSVAVVFCPCSVSGVNCTKQNTSSRIWSEFDW